MNRRHFIAVSFWAAAAIALQAPIAVAQAAGADEWIATWTSSPQPVWEADFLASVKVPRNLWGQTVRQMATDQPFVNFLQDFAEAGIGETGRPIR